MRPFCCKGGGLTPFFLIPDCDDDFVKVSIQHYHNKNDAVTQQPHNFGNLLFLQESYLNRAPICFFPAQSGELKIYVMFTRNATFISGVVVLGCLILQKGVVYLGASILFFFAQKVKQKQVIY